MLDWLERELEKGPPERQLKKKPEYKYPELLARLEPGETASQAFWDMFPMNPDQSGPAPIQIDEVKLWDLAVKLKYPNLAVVSDVCWEIEDGVEQGIDWASYKHTESQNNPSVTSEEWEKSIVDAVADWCDRGIAAGPFETRPPNTTIIKMTVREKSNGRARIIMDLSAPRPGSVNEAIKAEKVITAAVSYTHLTLPTICSV